MARLRSPSHPATPLEEAIEWARKIHVQEHQHPVARDIAVQHMGFSGISGTSDRAMAALVHYGLVEKVAKGEVRLSDLAVSILYPHSPSERRGALRDSAFRPELFQELHERYPDTTPSPLALGAYLSRSGFSAAAIGPATKAYIETCRFLQLEGAYESDGSRCSEDLESGSNHEEPTRMQTQNHQPIPAPVVPSIIPAVEPAMNEPNINIQGRRTVRIDALLDYDGLDLLKAQIDALKMLLLKPAAIAASERDATE